MPVLPAIVTVARRGRAQPVPETSNLWSLPVSLSIGYTVVGEKTPGRAGTLSGYLRVYTQALEQVRGGRGLGRIKGGACLCLITNNTLTGRRVVSTVMP